MQPNSSLFLIRYAASQPSELRPATIPTVVFPPYPERQSLCELIPQVADEVDGKQEARKKQTLSSHRKQTKEQTNETYAGNDIYQGKA